MGDGFLDGLIVPSSAARWRIPAPRERPFLSSFCSTIAIRREKGARTAEQRAFLGGQKETSQALCVDSWPASTLALPALPAPPMLAICVVRLCQWLDTSISRVLVRRETREAPEARDDDADAFSSFSFARVPSPFFSPLLHQRSLRSFFSSLPSLTTPSFFILSFSFSFWFKLSFYSSPFLAGPLLPTVPEAPARWRPSPTQSR